MTPLSPFPSSVLQISGDSLTASFLNASDQTAEVTSTDITGEDGIITLDLTRSNLVLKASGVKCTSANVTIEHEAVQTTNKVTHLLLYIQSVFIASSNSPNIGKERQDAVRVEDG